MEIYDMANYVVWNQNDQTCAERTWKLVQCTPRAFPEQQQCRSFVEFSGTLEPSEPKLQHIKNHKMTEDGCSLYQNSG